MKFPFKAAVWLFLAILAVPATFLGQTHPLPAPESKPLVICTDCVPPLPKWPYSAPIVKHRGRFLDSTLLRDVQWPIRTYRAERIAIVPERDRIYMKFGSTFVSYRLSTFFAKDLDGPMTSLNSGRSPEPEKYLPVIDHVYPERSSDWLTYTADGQERLGIGFDWDDRGYVYLPYTIFGWGIVKDVNGSFMFVKQMADALGSQGAAVRPTGMISFKHQGAYFVYVYDTLSLQGALFDVTDPYSPIFLKYLSHSIRTHATATLGGTQVIGYSDNDTGQVKIFSAAAFIANTAPEKVIPNAGQYKTAIASDGEQFFAASGGIPGVLSVIAPSSYAISSYAASTFTIPGANFMPESITYSQGVLTAVGGGPGGHALHMYRLTGGGPAWIDFNDFFNRYYSGYKDPASGKQYAGVQNSAMVYGAVFYAEKGKEYLAFGARALGDVYEIRAADGISIDRDGLGGTANPYSEGNGGPYYGDVFRFKTASTGASVPIDVDYGNPEASSWNVASTNTGVPLSYRYAGLDTAAKILQTRTVKVTDAGDLSKSASVGLTMEVPVGRVSVLRSNGVKDPSLLFLQPNASASVALVTGDSFVDASDGLIESHYSSWSLDGGSAVKQLPNVPFAVGQCGNHTLSFTASYGAYADLTSRIASDYTVGISNIQYAVRPFASRIVVASSDSTGIRFRPEIRVGTNVVTGGAGAAATLLWEVLDASGQPIRSSPSTATLGDTTEFAVTSTELATAKSVRLTVTLVDAAAIVGAGCAGMAASSDSVQLLVPDPALTVSGCTNAGGNCSITASSITGQSQSAWTYTWFLDGSQKSASGKTYTPTASELSQVGAHTVKVRVRNEAGISADSASAAFTLAAALCTTKPELLSFTWSGVNGSCAPGSCTSANTLQFNPKAWGYSFQDCDRYSWSFGDGTTSAEKTPTKKYANNGTYTVRLTVTNDVGSDFVDQTVTLGTVVTPPPPPPPPPPTGCDPPSPLVGFNATGGTTGCTGLIGAPDCAVGEAIYFTAANFPASKAFQSCDQFAWEFGDGGTSSQRNPTKVFAQSGAYTVKLTVSNAAGSVASTLPLKVGNSVDPSCKAPTDRAYLEFSAPSGCSSAVGSTPCNPGETVTLNIKPMGGSFQSCDTFDWNFGDGNTIPGTKNQTVQHVFPSTQPNYVVNVTIRNTAGTATVTETVRFGLLGADKPTSVDFSVGGATPVVGVPVTFTATATAPAEYPVTSWQWDFGDGIKKSGNPVQHTFSTEGTWNVTLTASNAGGSAPPLTRQIKVLKANAFTYLLPVVSHLDGANGSKWRTDLQIYNGNVGEGDVELEFELTNVQGMKKNFTLSTSTLILEDFMSFFRDDNWAGPVVIRGAAPHDLQIWTRTYSVGASGIGTYGHLIPAVRIDGNQGFTAGETTLYLTGAAATEKYRTNLYLLNITSAPMPVTITAFEGQFGAAVGQFSKEVAPFQLTPISASEISGIPKTKPFSLSIKGTSDGLIAYESVVDNGSNDPIYIPAISTADLGEEAMRNQILPSVGHAGLWKSDVTIFNPDDQAVQFDLTFYKDSTGELLAEAKDQILPAKGLLQLDDIIWSHAMVPQITADAIGTLRVNVDSPLTDRFVVVAQRNYSDSGDNRRFGQGILGVAATKPNVSAGKPAILPAVRSDQLYRSNVGLVNIGETDANVTISLLDQNSGQTIGMYSISLKPNESRILPDMIRFLHETADRGSIKVEVTNEGSVWAFATIIDKTTSDPEYVPAIPLN